MSKQRMEKVLKENRYTYEVLSDRACELCGANDTYRAGNQLTSGVQCVNGQSCLERRDAAGALRAAVREER